MKKILFFIFMLNLIIPNYALATTQTSGGVTFADTLGYTKPQFWPITIPDEGEVGSNIYYVDQASGSGSTCSEGSPCAWSGLAGKAGTTGGPAYIYLKGDTRLSLTSNTLYGAVGSEIVVMPWPGSSTPVTMTSAATTSTSNTNVISSANVHHIIFDGGPDMLFRFIGSGSSNQNAYNTIVNSDYVTIARSRFDGVDGGAATYGAAINEGSNTDRNWLINCEFYNVGSNLYGLYIGGGADCSTGSTTISYFYIINSIIRDINSSGLQMELRTSGSYLFYIGNAVHDIGRTVSRPAFDICSSGCGASYSNVYAMNNIAFDLGAGGFYINNSSGGTNYVYNNTVYDFSNYSPITANSHAIDGYSSNSAYVTNNLLLLTHNGAEYLGHDTNFTKSGNLCPGECDYSDATPFLSTSQASSDFLKIGTGDAVGNGTDLTSFYASVSTSYFDGRALLSYFGDSLATAPLDIGADQEGEEIAGATPTASGGSAGSGVTMITSQ